MKNGNPERAALDVLKSAREKALAMMTALTESQLEDSGLAGELVALARSMVPKGNTRYFALFNAVSNTIQCLEVIWRSRRDDNELCRKISAIMDELVTAQQNAEEKYMGSGETLHLRVL